MQEHGDRDWADAAGYGGNRGGNFLDGVEIHVAAELAVRPAVHADIDDDGAAPHHVGFQEQGLADGYNDDIAASGNLRQIAAAAVADRHRGVGAGGFLHQDQRQRLAHDVATADDDDVFAVRFDAVSQ